MLNIGQVVYDYTNERVLIFAGMRMLQCQQTAKCTVETAFIMKDGFIHLKNGRQPWFKYTNLVIDTKPVMGSFVDKFELNGHYFGIVDGTRKDVKAAAKAAIEEVEILIAEHGLRVVEMGSGDREYSAYYINVDG